MKALKINNPIYCYPLLVTILLLGIAPLSAQDIEDANNEFEITAYNSGIEVINTLFGQDVSSVVSDVNLVGGGSTITTSQIGFYNDLDTRLNTVNEGEGYGVVFSTSYIVAGTDSMNTNTNSAEGDFVLGAGNTDPDFNDGTGVYDVASIAFTINLPEASDFDIIGIFASEEYLEYVDEDVNDAAKIFIDGVNIALVNGDELSIDNVNSTSNSAFYINNPANSGNYPFAYDGFTTPLSFSAFLSAGNHTIKIGVADRGDISWGSAFFFQGGSLNISGLPEPPPSPCDPVASGNTDTDGDDISDVCDLDDDNDGILDTEECPIEWGDDYSVSTNGTNSSGTISTPSGLSADFSTENTDFQGFSGIQFTSYTSGIEIKHQNQDGNPDQFRHVASFTAGDQSALGMVRILQVLELTTQTNHPSTMQLDWNGSGLAIVNDPDNQIDNLADGDIVAPGVIASFSGVQNSDATWYIDIKPEGITGAMNVEVNYNSVSSNLANEWVSFSVALVKDTDNDGILDCLDLDSDEDGCPDALEGGAGLVYANLNADGSINANVNDNGIPVITGVGTTGAGTTGQADVSSKDANTVSSVCDNPCTGGAIVGTPTANDPDADGINNDCDLDDDNDGILDADESCPAVTNTDAKHIVLIIDESTNIQGIMITQIRKGLTEFINAQIGSGNTVSFIGMSGADTNNRTDHVVGVEFPVDGTDNTAVFDSWILNYQLRFNDDVAYYYTSYWSSGFDYAANNMNIGTGDEVILISDGNFGHHIYAQENVEAIESAGAHIFAIGADNNYYVYLDDPVNVDDGVTLNFDNVPGSTYNPIQEVTDYTVDYATSEYDRVADFEELTTTLKTISSVLAGNGGCIADADGDGILNALDLDADGDGCPDALEGGANLAYADLNADGSINAPVNDNGIPVLAGVGTTGTGSSGQADVSSQDNTVFSSECNAYCPPTPGEKEIAGTVFDDLNQNGIQDSGETGDAGIEVAVYIDNNNNGVIDATDELVSTEITDANGDYAYALPRLEVRDYFFSGTLNGGTGWSTDWSVSNPADIELNGSSITLENNVSIWRSVDFSNATAVRFSMQVYGSETYFDDDDGIEVQVCSDPSFSNCQTVFNRQGPFDFAYIPLHRGEIDPMYVTATTTLRVRALSNTSSNESLRFLTPRFTYQSPEEVQYLMTVNTSSLNSEASLTTDNIETAFFSGFEQNACSNDFGYSTGNPCTDGAIVGTPTANDPDADGINNECDLDDDNDGILDTDECPTAVIPLFNNSDFNAGGNPNDYSQLTLADDWIQVSEGTSDYMKEGEWVGQEALDIGIATPSADGGGWAGFLTSSASSFDVYFEYIGGELINPITTGNYDLTLEVGASSTDWYSGAFEQDIVIYGIPNANDLPFDGYGNIMNSGINAVELGRQTVTRPESTWADETIELTVNGTFESLVIGGDNPQTVEEYQYVLIDNIRLFGGTSVCDTDNDGIPNYLDLDSDNDGCPDFVEGGGNFFSADGTVASNTLTGGTGSSVNTNLGINVGSTPGVDLGVPIVLTTPVVGQTVGASQDPDDNSSCCNLLVTFDETITICEGQTAIVNGVDYTTAQEVVNVYPSALGCDSTVTTTIVVNPLVTYNETVTICQGETTNINGINYSIAQDITHSYISALGCDSTVTTTLVVNPLVTFDETITICEGQTATVNGVDYTTAQEVVNVYPSALGCDSTVTTTIVVNPLVTYNETVTICQGETTNINGINYSIAQDITYSYISALGCDSTVTTTLVVNPLVTFDETITICEGQTAIVNGVDYTTAQEVVNVYPSALGCDSTVTTTIVVNPLVTYNETVTICQGETTNINGINYSIAQDITYSYISALGCDSTVTTTLVVNPLVTFDETITICEGQTATVNGVDYTTAQEVVNVYPSALGCDSTVTTTIVVNPLVTYNETVTICQGETTNINGINYSIAQDITHSYVSALGCDSTVTTTLVVNPLVTFDETITICEGQTAIVNGVDYTTAQEVVNVYPSALGCDSTVTTTIVVNPLVTYNETVTICQGETTNINGINYSIAQDITHSYISALGCDSTVTTTLVVNPLVTFDETITICEGQTATVNGVDYTTAQEVVNVYPSALGCDSTVTTTIVVNPLVTYNETVTICQGETTNINGINYSIAQDITYSYISALGCDSTVTTTLVVNPLVTFDETITICEGQTAIVNGVDYTTAQDVVNVYPSALGCDSTVTTTIVVNPNFSTVNEVAICEGGTYSEGDSDYTTAGTYTDVYASVLGCDSTVTTILSVDSQFEVTNVIEICDGEEYIEGTNIYTETGIYLDTYTSTLGCDSLVTTDLTVNNCCIDQFTTNEVSVCDGESYFEQASEYTTAGTYTDIYPTVDGCDSTVTTILTINPLEFTTNEVSICEGGTYSEGDNDYTTAGTYTDVYASVLGCDSTVTTILSVDSQFEVTNVIEICDGEEYIEGTNIYTETGIYVDAYTSTLGCDSLVTTDLTVNNCCIDQFTTNEVSVCDGESYFEQASEYTVAGTYTDIYPTVDGCDSTVTTILTLNPLEFTTNEVSICEGGTYSEGDSDYTTAGTYTDVYASVLGCDSTVTTILSVDSQFEVTNVIEICDGEEYMEGANTYNETGIYVDAYTSTLGCDSLVTTDLTVNNCCIDQFTTNEVSVCDGESYFEQASEYTVAGTYTDIYPTVDGCDSTVTTILTLNPLEFTTNEVSICEGGTYSEGDNDYTTAGTYTEVYPSVLGCDSTVTTILSVDSQFEVTNVIEICDGEEYIEGTNIYTETGIYLDTYTSTLGCDSLVTTDLTVNNCCIDQFTTNEISVCDGESYFEQASEYTTAGTYTDIYPTVDGCDSTVTTILTINPLEFTTNEVSICEGGTYSEGDNDYTTAGTYTDVYASVLGCDSTVTTILSVDSQFEVTNVIEICDGEEYIEGTNTYTETGIYVDAYTSTLGCDSLVTTDLTVNNCCIDQFTTNEVSVCDGESYFEQASEYTTAGTYTDIYPTVDGCDSTVITILSINPSLEFTNDITICTGETHTEGTSIYNTTGIYSDLYTTTQGCDSMIITNLTVTNTISVTNEISLCSGETYSEGNNTYDETGVYTNTYTSVLGCDSIVTTNLVIQETLISPNFIVLCGGETWNEGESAYDVTGTYEDIYTSINGCDSIVITDLLILDIESTTNFIEICAGSSHIEGISVYDQTGVYSDVYQDIDGCDSTVITNLTVLPPVETINNVQICTGSTYTEGSSVYDTEGTFTDNYTTANGCDSIVTTNLSISDFITNTNTISICDGETYTEEDSVYDQTGTYNNTYTTAEGCDSLVVTILTVNLPLFSTASPTICQGEVYTEGTSNYTVSGAYTDVYTSSLGCDSTVTTLLTVIDQIDIENSVSICEGEIHTEGDSQYDTSGTYSDIYTSVQGCDSIITTILAVNALQSTTNTITICQGENYLEGTSVYSETGIYTDVYQSIAGCDSTVTTLLTVNPTMETELSQLVCENQPIPQFGDFFDELNNRFIDSLQTSIGCDSIVFTYLEFVDPEVVLPSEVTLCNGQSFVANIDGINEDWTVTWSTGTVGSSETFSEEGNYWVELSSAYCNASDSISISVDQPLTYGLADLIICSDSDLTIDLSEEDGSITWNDGSENSTITIEEPGTYTAQIVNTCGSYIYSATVEEEDCSCKIYVPNAFTADGDNLNDVFTVEHYCDFEEYELIIFNRWGEMVFSTTNPDEAWNGNHQNGDHYVQEGVYTYMLKYSSKDLENKIIADKIYGSITIVR